MDFIKDKLSGHGGDKQPQQQGGFNLADGFDMTDVKGLASAFSQTKDDPNASEDDPSQVAQKLGGDQQAGSAMSKLTTMFSKETGKTFTGSDEDNELLSMITQKVTGTSIPPSMLWKMAKMSGQI